MACAVGAGRAGAGMSAIDLSIWDYRDHNRRFGWDLSYAPIGGNRLRATGWGAGIKAGDYILLSNGDSDTRYRFCSIDYYADPADMWRAVLEFAPRAAT